MDLTARIEDYLEAILDIEMSGVVPTVTRMAANLGVTKATVTAALKKLKSDGLLEHERYGDVMLTPSGREKALEIYRRHEFLSDFFVRILGFSRERAQSVACVMEHEIDRATEIRLAAFTDAITQAERNNEAWLSELVSRLDVANELPVPLCLMPNGSSGVIARITAQYDLRHRLNAAGFVPGAEISGIKRTDEHKIARFAVTMNKMDITFGIAEASAVWLYQPQGQ